MLASFLKARLRECRTAQELRCLSESLLQKTFHCCRFRMFLFEDFDETFDLESKLSQNPVSKKFLENEISLHEAQVVDNVTWRKLCPRADHGHVLMGPLLLRSTLVGALAVTRQSETESFNCSELAKMNRLSLYISGRLAEIESHSPQIFVELTPRERDVAKRVTAGLRNSEVADELNLSIHTVKQYLKSIYRKLAVKNRTELARSAAGKPLSILLVHYRACETVHLLPNIPDITQKCPVPPAQNALRNMSRHFPAALLGWFDNHQKYDSTQKN